MIGKDVIRNDGPAKVTGKGRYGADLVLPGMLYAACRYTDIICGKIVSMDTEAARKCPGVHTVATYTDIPGDKRIGTIRRDQYVLTDDRVFFTGDVHAIVAAETKEQAWQAADTIRMEYMPEEGVFDIEEAALPGTRSVQPDFPDNVLAHYPLRKGNVELGFAESAHILERVYHTGFQEHAYIEPETVTAEPDVITGGVKLYGSIQNPFTTRRVVAGFLGLKLNQVNVIPSLMGGSFGGKDDILSVMACRVALLAMRTGRPVQLTNSRENSFRESYKRHPYRLRYKVGFDNDGLLKAMEIDVLADSGAYSSQSFFVTWRSVVQATGPYNIPNVKTDVRAVYTNNPYTGAFRGYGSPQVIFGVESLMDEIAGVCKLDPVTIRERNGFRQGSLTASGQPLDAHRVSLLEALSTATERAGFLRKWRSLHDTGRYRRGIGLALSYRGCSLGAEGVDATSAIVSMQADGSVYVVTALHENGQGLQTAFCMIAAEVLGCSMSDIRFIEPQTAIIADGGSTVASRSTLMGGKAVQLATEKVRNELFEAIQPDLGVDDISATVWADGVIRTDHGREIKLADAVNAAMKQGRCLAAYGWYKAPDASWDEETGQGNAYFTYVYGCQVAEVKVDTITGRIEVTKMTAVHDVGRIINRLGAFGQIYGGVAQGIGYGVFENFEADHGKITAENLDEYLIPTAVDVPPIDAAFLENSDSFGPFGAKSLGEPTLELGATAVANAVAQALGKRFYDIPLTLERVRIGENLRRPERESEKSIARGKNTAYIGKLEIVNPGSLEEALELLSKGDYLPLAGGTDVLIRMRKSAKPRKLLNIFGLRELNSVEPRFNGLTIGSGTTITRVLATASRPELRSLQEGATTLGSLQIRNRATIGGNIVNAAPCADTVPPLLLYDAEVELVSRTGNRTLPLSEFIVGQYRTQLHPDELLGKIILPITPLAGTCQSYAKVGRRGAVNIGRMSLAMAGRVDNGRITCIRLAMGAMWSYPKRLVSLEKWLAGRDWDAETRRETEAFLREMFEQDMGKRWSSPYKIPVAIDLILHELDAFSAR
jgi:CO/xanthine dehydrogenase Mo-binding subunit/CO/xanthine dehydrogenase FAD-binding subunit